MKFLVIIKPGRVAPPPEKYAALLQASKEWIEAELAAGTTECVYNFVPRGGIAIGNADSAEEIYDRIVTYPLYPYFDWKVKPLADWKHVFETGIKQLSR